MTDRSQRQQELNAAADAALKAATGALGTDRFPLLLVEYHRAMERVSACRPADRRTPKGDH